MKSKIYLLFILIFFCRNHSLNAQNIYNFSHATGVYTPLANPTIVVSNSGFTGAYNTLALNFTFQFCQTPYTNFVFTTSAYCSFTAGMYGFYPFYSSLKGLGNSQIGYEHAGVAPNRILKVEWKHVGFTNDNTNTDSTSFQIWIYETTNVVEMHFGPSNINSAHFQSLFGSSIGPQIVFDRPDGGDYYNLQGNASSPAMIYHPSTFLYITGYPADGTVFVFSPASLTSINEALQSNGVTILTNPVSESFEFSIDDFKSLSQKENIFLTVYNAAGTLVLHKEIIAPAESIDFSRQSSGIYYAEITYGNSAIVRKIIKE